MEKKLSVTLKYVAENVAATLYFNQFRTNRIRAIYK